MNEFVYMEKFYMAAMGDAKGLGHKGIAQLVKDLGSATAAWLIDFDELLSARTNHKTLEAFLAFRRENPDAPEKLRDFCEWRKINLCSIADEDYPTLLKEIDSPPMFFYYRGKLQSHVQRIAIVGSRRSSTYGEDVAFKLGEELAAAGLTVVSGAAVGIDTFAQRGALKTGRTVAVLGCGIDSKVSYERQKFLEQIAENGVVISEFNPQMSPAPWSLATRNRIVAGLCKGIIVVEAALKSGTMITANYANTYRRDVFVVSKSNYADNSLGCNKLLCGGAIPIKSTLDVFDRYSS